MDGCVKKSNKRVSLLNSRVKRVENKIKNESQKQLKRKNKNQIDSDSDDDGDGKLTGNRRAKINVDDDGTRTCVVFGWGF